MYSGSAALDYLAIEVGKSDPGESSHWQKYHSSFRFKGDGFEGIQGFGGHRKPSHGLVLTAERKLQSKFRRMGGENFSTIDTLACEITRTQNRAYDLDVLRQALSVSFLARQAPFFRFPTSLACVIGDGFASMTALLLASNSASRVVLVNLSKTLLVDLWYLKLWMGAENFEKSVDLVTGEDALLGLLEKPSDVSAREGKVIAIQAKDHMLLRYLPLTMAVNIASMQEMDPPVIAEYFNDLRNTQGNQPLVFYCCNRVEKFLPDGTITRFTSYPWSTNDNVLVDELCPWHQYYYSFFPPFFRPYDGPIRHRLVVLDKNS